MLSGMVTGAKEGGALVLKTQMGELVIRSPQVLPTDRILLLQIPPGAPPVRAQVSVMGGALPSSLSSSLVVPTTSLSVPVDPVTAAASTGLPMMARVAQNTAAGAETKAAPTTMPLPMMASLLTDELATTPLRALELVPILEGTLLPAKIMALPQLVSAQTLVAPSAVIHSSATGQPKSVVPQPTSIAAAVGQLREAGAPVLSSVLASGLEEVIAHLPPAVFAPLSRSSGGVVPMPDVPQPTVVSAQPVPLQKPMLAGLPKFANLPAVLTLPPGSQVTVQINSVVLPLPPLSHGALTPPTMEGSDAVSLAPLSQPQSQSNLQTGALQPEGPKAAPVSVSAMPASTASGVQGMAAAPLMSGQSGPRSVAPRPEALSVQAEIVGTTPAGEPLATSAVGLIVLDSKAPLPVGTRLELNIVHVSESAPAADETVMPRMQPDWASLQAVLAQAIGHGADQPLRIPRAEAHLGSSTVFLLAALKLGDGRAFLTPEAESALRQISLRQTPHSGLLSGLADEVKTAAQSWTRAEQPASAQMATSEWKTLSYPLPPDSALTRLALHLKTERDAASPEAPAAGQRLVLELELTRLGPMLLDGLILGRRMDMMLRSQRRLPKALYDELRVAWRESLNAMNWSGDLNFQTAADLWLSR